MKKYKDQRGSALVQVIVVASIVTALGVGINQIIGKMMGTSKRNAQDLSINAIVSDINRILQDQDVCTKTFQGAGPYTSIYFRNYVNGKWELVEKYKIGEAYGSGAGRVFLKDIQLSKQNDDITQVQLEVIKSSRDDEKAASKGGVGTAVVNKRFNIKAIWDGSSLKSCFSIPDEDKVTFCTSLGGTEDSTDGSGRCMSIHIEKLDGIGKPAITATHYVQSKKGIAVGPVFTASQDYVPPKGSIHSSASTLVNKRVILNPQSKAIDTNAPQMVADGGLLQIKNRTGSDIVIGKNAPVLTRKNGLGLGINESSPENGYDLDIKGHLKVEKKIELDDNNDIEFSSPRLRFNVTSAVSVVIEGGKNKNYNSGGNIGDDNEIATREWVLAVLKDTLNKNQAALDNIRKKAEGAASKDGDIYIRRSVCDGSKTLNWTSNGCQLKLPNNVNCQGNNQAITRIEFETGNFKCDQITPSNIYAADRIHSNSQHVTNYSAVHSHTNLVPTHNHPYALIGHLHNDIHPASHAACRNQTRYVGYSCCNDCVTSGSPSSAYRSCPSGYTNQGTTCSVCDCFWGLKKRKCYRGCPHPGTLP